MIAKRMEKVRYAIRDIVEEADRLRKQGRKIISLNIGDPNKFDFVPPQHITDTVCSAVRSKRYTGYAPSQGDPELLETVADIEAVPQENVVITQGLTEGVYFIIEAIVNPGDNVLLPSPCYPLYIATTEMFGGSPRYYKAVPYPDPEELRSLIDNRTKLIVVINPNNPTGALYPKKVVKQICDIAGEHRIPIMSDEVYDRLVFKGNFTKTCSVAKDVPVIRGYSISKVYFYPGARVGYLAFHGNEKQINRIRDATHKLANARLSINWEMQKGAVAAFAGDHGFLRSNLAKLKKRRDYAYNRIKMIDWLDTTLPDAGFYMFVKVNLATDDWQFARDLLQKTGVVIVPGSGFSPMLEETYFRAVYLPDIQTLGDAFDRIENYCQNYCQQSAAKEQ